MYAKAGCGLWSAGEPGLVVEAYQLEGRPGWTLLFKRGGYDGFSPEDMERFVVKEGSVDAKAAGYVFESVGKLDRDWRAGRFDFEGFKPYGEWKARQEAGELSKESKAGAKRELKKGL